VRGHWGIENQFHWVLEAVFGDDQSRLRKGHGVKNMAARLRRKCAGWDPNICSRFSPLSPVNLDSEPWIGIRAA